MESGYMTKFSESHSTFRFFLMEDTRRSGTSWPRRVPCSSTISIVTSSGRGKRESQNTAAAKSLQMHFPRPTGSRSMDPEKTLTESSSLIIRAAI